MKKYILGITLAAVLEGCAGPDVRAQVNQELSSQGIPGLRTDIDEQNTRLQQIEARYERLGIRSATNVQGLDLLERKIETLYLRALEQDANTFRLSLDATRQESDDRREALRTEGNTRREVTTRVLDYIQTTHALLDARYDLHVIHDEIETRRERMLLGYEARIRESTETQKRDLIEQYSREEQTLEESYQPRIRAIDARIEELRRAFEQAPQRINSADRQPRRVS